MRPSEATRCTRQKGGIHRCQVCVTVHFCLAPRYGATPLSFQEFLSKFSLLPGLDALRVQNIAHLIDDTLTVLFDVTQQPIKTTTMARFQILKSINAKLVKTFISDVFVWLDWNIELP